MSASVTHALSLVHTRRAAQRTDGGRPPLVLLLHGVGSNEQSMASLANTLDPSMEVLCVRSPITLGAGSYAWFHVQFTAQGPVINPDEAAAGWASIAQFATEAVTAYDADPARVVVGGFSQGGIMSLAAMLTAPQVFAGAMCLSGRLLPEVWPNRVSDDALRGKPVLIVHGTADSKLGIHFARSAKERLETVPIALTYVELPVEHQITQETVTRLHEWLAPLVR
jgi:phospholipase/carboxylesterase